ncbi:two component transcriptional regulator, winged helix family [Thermobaculum terrenum ATCC BAA-798]|uniref:Two component transcriptional regulator, winged helix family n=1 Tax=Thermobaculum terrenum (strain ATCC BAA-798 / CCMEE 7001 / YNP1) TaxID=525904 RepID=D1CB49_THET1|nr:response regulator transcription factor [Thermobaculum terrenum]ACZ42014.1 two component transcriptional regulator, winged helix family [Thermobaculum terrenum ATCC BAA-798]
MERPLILVIDDDKNITSFLRRALSYAGYEVKTAHNGQEGLQVALSNAPDLVILDWLMPDMDGIEVCKRLRSADNIPILMLTAKDEVSDRVQGLEAGADDYLVKPFAHEELIARVKALLRRASPDSRKVLRFADLSVDLGTREVKRGQRVIDLTAKEFDLLVTFMQHPRQVLTRDQLLQIVWGFDMEVESHVVAVYVGYLRDKLEAGGESRLIHTLRGVGYVLRESNEK